MFQLEVKGRNNIPKAAGFILASNHASYLDPIVLGVASPRKLNFMARHDLFSIPFFGSLIRNVGAFPLRRNSADIASLKEALRRLQQARGLLLFPEGSRAFGGSAQKAEPGVGFIAARSQAPVVPTFVSGSQRALGHNARFIRLAKVKVYFGKPIYLKNRELKKSYDDFARRVIQEIKRLGQEGGNIINA